MTEFRQECLRCRRPTDLCVCATVRRVCNRTGVTILQHPGERDHPFNTARLARLALEDVALHTAWDGRIEAVDLPPGAAVLYPGPDATLLGEGPSPAHLVVLDGTWPQAKALYRDSPWLQQLPCVGLAPVAPSSYRIRREPAAHCLSTIEAIHAALSAIEPDTPGLDALLDGFDALVEGQLAQLASRQRRPRRVKRTSQRPRMRELLHRRWADVVVLYAETTPVRGRAGGRGVEVLQLTAVRPATGETFDRLATVREPPDAHLLGHMGLDGNEVNAAAPFAALAAHWRAFARASDLHVAWSQAGARTALSSLGDSGHVLHLKPLYCNLRGPKAGRPDQIVAREGLVTRAVEVRGRAAQRLANAAAIADFLRERPPGDVTRRCPD